MVKHMAVACCPASSIQNHMTANHMFAWLGRKQSDGVNFHPLPGVCISKHWQEICIRLKHQSDEGTLEGKKKVRISFEHLDMEKDLSKWNWRYTSAWAYAGGGGGGGGGVDGFERPPPSPMRGHLHHWKFFFHIAY